LLSNRDILNELLIQGEDRRGEVFFFFFCFWKNKMDSPTASTTEGSTARIVTSRSSVIESIRGCGLSGLRVNKEDLKRKLSMPKYLRHAIRDSINSKDVNAAADRYREGNSAGREEAPEGPMVVFVNSRSGGRHGPELKERLQQLMGEEQVMHCVSPPFPSVSF
jgi:diacylglycerol kinase (ATP)